MVLFHRLSTLSRVYLLSTVLSFFFNFFSRPLQPIPCPHFANALARGRGGGGGVGQGLNVT